jgi:large subunit ribosomal protein L4
METKMLLASEQKKIKRIGLIHRIFLTELKNRRRHTASTKTKSEVRGGGRKPWRQKGTGNARAGSIRSPLWVGGGVSFGPRPHLVSKKINKKEKRLGILAALSLKSKILIDEQNLSLNTTNSILKTKNVVLFFKETLKIPTLSKCLFIVKNSNISSNFSRAAKNLKNIKFVQADSLNISLLLEPEYIICTKEALETISLLYGELYE